MWEAYDLGNEDLLWAGIPFNGGIGGRQQAPCGAVSASAVCLGLRHRGSLADKEKAKDARNTIRLQAGKLVDDFTQQFGDIICKNLLGLDFNVPGTYQKFRESGKSKETCERYVLYVVDKLFALEEARGAQPAGS
jgi:C_GCAxxG_C_C family probable redox protein